MVRNKDDLVKLLTVVHHITGKVNMAEYRVQRFKLMLEHEARSQHTTPRALWLTAIMKTLVERVHIQIYRIQKVLLEEDVQDLDPVELRWILKTIGRENSDGSTSWDGLGKYSDDLLDSIYEFAAFKAGLK